MTNIDNEIAPTCLHDLILWVFGRDREADGNTEFGSGGTSSAVECPANQTRQEEPNEPIY
jgi:hypothetical protein